MSEQAKYPIIKPNIPKDELAYLLIVWYNSEYETGLTIDKVGVMAKTFYVYILARPDGTPFYVGKGSTNRISRHEKEAQRGHDCHKCNTIRKIWRDGGEIQKQIVFTTENEDEAFEHEMFLIQHYGYDTLTNKTQGGEGSAGRKLTPEQLSHHAKVHKEKWDKPGMREKASEKARKHRADPEYRKHMSELKKQQYRDNPELRKRLSEAAKQRLANGDTHILEIREKSHTPEARAKMSASQKQRVVDNPALREEMRNRSSTLWQDDEFRAKMLQSFNQRNADGSYGKAISETKKKQLQTPEGREMMRKKAKDGWAKRKAEANRIASASTLFDCLSDGK